MKSFLFFSFLSFTFLTAVSSEAKVKTVKKPQLVWVCETRPLIQESGDPVTQCEWVKK
jgi:hypothetical protein